MVVWSMMISSRLTHLTNILVQFLQEMKTFLISRSCNAPLLHTLCFLILLIIMSKKVQFLNYWVTWIQVRCVALILFLPDFWKRVLKRLVILYQGFFNCTYLCSGTLPQDWISAHIVPVHEKNDKSNPSNYRPTSLTSIIFS